MKNLSDNHTNLKISPSVSWILCYYINETSQLQNIRISNIPNWSFERLVFPKESLFFEASSQAQLEVYGSNGIGNKVLQNRINCSELQIGVKQKNT